MMCWHTHQIGNDTCPHYVTSSTGLDKPNWHSDRPSVKLASQRFLSSVIRWVKEYFLRRPILLTNAILKCDLAIALCRPSVCDVGGLWSHMLVGNENPNSSLNYVVSLYRKFTVFIFLKFVIFIIINFPLLLYLQKAKYYFGKFLKPGYFSS